MMTARFELPFGGCSDYCLEATARRQTTGGCPAISGATPTLLFECPRLAQLSLLNLAHSSQTRDASLGKPFAVGSPEPLPTPLRAKIEVKVTRPQVTLRLSNSRAI